MRLRRALGFARRALAFIRTHSSSCLIVRWRASSFRALLLEPFLLLLEPARVVALIWDPAATVELENPAGDVVQEVAVVVTATIVPV